MLAALAKGALSPTPAAAAAAGLPQALQLVRRFAAEPAAAVEAADGTVTQVMAGRRGRCGGARARERGPTPGCGPAHGPRGPRPAPLGPPGAAGRGARAPRARVCA